LVRETRLGIDDLIFPLFAVAEQDARREIPSIPGSYYLSGRHLAEEARAICGLGIPAVLLFGIPRPGDKDDEATPAFAPDGPTQAAARIIREAAPELTVIADLCLCEFVSHGNCGLLEDGVIDNDRTLEVVRRAAVSQAEAGSHVIAPSGMMDGAVQVIRAGLDEEGYTSTLTMPYSAKFATQLYGPFKRSTDSEPDASRHETHQLDLANGDEAIREIEQDIEEGADMVIVKPALPALDIIHRAKSQLRIPVAAYAVSGEYSMVVSAGRQGILDADAVLREMLTCIKRAGADMIITYAAKSLAPHLAR
jgi:porphobilinogen synthase